MRPSPERPALFVGGITGRTGTSWAVESITQATGGTHAAIGELGIFVLSQFRGAPCDFYQFGFGPPREQPSAFLKYFKEFMLTKAYNRRVIYGSGLKGIQPYLSTNAVEGMLEKFATDLEGIETLSQGKKCLGRLYLDILDEIARLHYRNRTWISKEPSYGRHADELLAMIPNARLLIMARDGRDVILSMKKKHGIGPLRHFIDRYREFSEMTLRALEKCPASQYKIVRYEDLANDFANQLGSVLEFFGIAREDFNLSVLPDSARPKATPNPRNRRSDITREDILYFERTCGEVMDRLGYTL